MFYRAYFIAVALSGVFAVTFSIVFAYVADCTSENERSCSYGLVSHKEVLCVVLFGWWLYECEMKHSSTVMKLCSFSVHIF